MCRPLALALALTACHSTDAMFFSVDAYERFMGRWSQQLAVPFIRFSGIEDGQRVLDIGSGTGSLAFAVAAATSRSEIVGIDPATAYVEHASAKAADPRVRFEVGDAQALPYADGSFDTCASLLVINFIPDPALAVGEMQRVTRPGGTVAAAVWDYGEGMQMLRAFWDAVIALDPAAADRDERNMPLCKIGQLATLWHEAGLDGVEETGLTIELEFASFADFWQPFLGKQGPAGAYVAELTDQQRATLRDRVRSNVLGDGPDRAFTLAARAWAVRGTVRG